MVPATGQYHQQTETGHKKDTIFPHRRSSHVGHILPVEQLWENIKTGFVNRSFRLLFISSTQLSEASLFSASGVHGTLTMITTPRGLEMLCTLSLRLRFFARRRGVWIHGTAAASGRFPSIVRGTVLEEAGILAERMARRIELGVGLAEEFARPQCFIVNLVHQVLVTVVVLRESREGTQIVVADNHDIHARHRRYVIGIGSTGWRLDHNHNQHVVVEGLAIVDTVNAPDARGLA